MTHVVVKARLRFWVMEKGLSFHLPRKWQAVPPRARDFIKASGS